MANRINDFASKLPKSPKGMGTGLLGLAAGAGLLIGAYNSFFTGKSNS